MKIQNQELLSKILKAEKQIVSYFTYPLGTIGSSYIAEDELPKEGIHSEIITVVDAALLAATLAMDIKRDNKTGVKCKIEGIEEFVYFVAFDLKRVICTEVNVDRGTTEIILKSDDPIPSKKYKHYKGGTYEALMLAVHTETKEELVVYRNLEHNTIHARPLNVWKSWKNGRPRFELIN